MANIDEKYQAFPVASRRSRRTATSRPFHCGCKRTGHVLPCHLDPHTKATLRLIRGSSATTTTSEYASEISTRGPMSRPPVSVRFPYYRGRLATRVARRSAMRCGAVQPQPRACAHCTRSSNEIYITGDELVGTYSHAVRSLRDGRAISVTAVHRASPWPFCIRSARGLIAPTPRLYSHETRAFPCTRYLSCYILPPSRSFADVKAPPMTFNEGSIWRIEAEARMNRPLMANFRSFVSLALGFRL